MLEVVPRVSFLFVEVRFALETTKKSAFLPIVGPDVLIECSLLLSKF